MYQERLEKIIEKRNRLEELSAKHPDVLKDDFAANCGEDLKQEEKIRQNYAEKIDANRDLQIGIVGRVKAGKSSLLNALLFQGESILPKAATPMTAALTILSYSEKIELKIRFFDQADLAALKDKSNAYESKYAKLVKAIIEDSRHKAETKAAERGNRIGSFDENKAKERAEREAKRKLAEEIDLSGAYEQFQKIKESSVQESEVCGQTKILYPSSLGEIASMLADYVGSEGKYMPFTQSVEIAFPNENLKGVRIVDTPGFNDPVPSREQRAYQLLKASDVVLILSPAGSYLNASDKDVLQKITTKDGLREIFVLASQIDTQLYGGEYECYNGDVFRVREEIKKRLASQTASVLGSLNSDGIFDQLLSGDGDRILMTSGDCHSMYLTFSNKENWDENKKTVWKNLCENFPNYFSEKDSVSSAESLKKLGNMELVDEKIHAVKLKKEEILAESANQQCVSLENAVNDLAEDLKRAVKSQMERIRSANLESLQNEKNGIESFCLKVEPSITRTINEAVAEWRSASTKDLIAFVNSLQNDAKSESASYKENFTRDHSYTTGHLWWKQRHHYQTEHTRISITQVRSSIEDFVEKNNNSLKREVLDSLEKLKSNIASKIFIVWADKAADQSLEADAVANKIRAIIESLQLPEFKIPSGQLPSPLLNSGSVEDEEVTEILGEAKAFLSKMANSLTQMLTEEIHRYAMAIQKADIASELLGRYRNQLDTLIKDIENKEKSIESYENVLKELESI